MLFVDQYAVAASGLLLTVAVDQRVMNPRSLINFPRAVRREFCQRAAGRATSSDPGSVGIGWTW